VVNHVVDPLGHQPLDITEVNRPYLLNYRQVIRSASRLM
jgi:hypothetical protein